MNKFLVVIFPDETKAYEGVRELRALHEEGTVTVFSTAVVQRETSGALTIKQKMTEGPIGLGLGAVFGALAGLIAGPVGAAVGVAAGSVAGGSIDLLQAGVSREFLEDVRRDLAPGKFALIAEVSEDWLTPIDTRMGALGGSVIRERRVDFVDDLIEKKTNARKADFAEWQTERATAKAERMQQKLMEGVERARNRLEYSADEARVRLHETKEEIEAKLEALQEQAAKAKPEVRVRITQRIAELRTDFAEREQKLTRAYDLAREALRGAPGEVRP